MFHVFIKGRLVQLARMSELHSEGRGFESLIAHFNWNNLKIAVVNSGNQVSGLQG